MMELSFVVTTLLCQRHPSLLATTSKNRSWAQAEADTFHTCAWPCTRGKPNFIECTSPLVAEFCLFANHTTNFGKLPSMCAVVSNHKAMLSGGKTRFFLLKHQHLCPIGENLSDVKPSRFKFRPRIKSISQSMKLCFPILPGFNVTR